MKIIIETWQIVKIDRDLFCNWKIVRFDFAQLKICALKVINLSTLSWRFEVLWKLVIAPRAHGKARPIPDCCTTNWKGLENMKFKAFYLLWIWMLASGKSDGNALQGFTKLPLQFQERSFRTSQNSGEFRAKKKYSKCKNRISIQNKKKRFYCFCKKYHLQTTSILIILH